MLKCILSDRLYVPESLVTEEHLEKFTYQIQDDTYDYESFSASISSIHTYARVQTRDGIYYAFARGNISKLYNIFGEYSWLDKTSTPDITSNLLFKGKLHTWQSSRIGQQEAVDSWMIKKSGIIKAPPRFGKTISSIYIITKLKKKTLIVTHQIDLLEQYYKSLLAFTNVNEVQYVQPGQKKRDAYGRIVGFFHDYDNPEELDVCLLCWQTFARKYGMERIAKYGRSWGLVIVDECHKVGGVCYARIINRLATRYRLGLTGTVARVDGREFLLHDIIGSVVAEGKVHSIPCSVIVTYTNVEIKHSIMEPLPYFYKRIFKNNDRMSIILNDLLLDVDNGRSICFAFHRYSSEQLCEWTRLLVMHGIKAEAFYGTCHDRDGALERARSGETQVLVCNSQMLTGIDIPRWDTYYSAFPTSNVVFTDTGGLSGNFYQEYSRIRTPFIGDDGTPKRNGILRDYVDANSFCYGSYTKREKAYKHENFSIEVKYIKRSSVEKPTL